MSLRTTVKAALDGESDVTELLTGGIYDFEETGRQGITYTNTPAAFNDSSLLPCAMIKTRSIYANRQIRDEAAQVMSFQQIVEIWVFQDDGLDVLESVKQEIFEVLHDQLLDGFFFQLAGVREGRQSEELNGANEMVMDFQVFGLMQPGS